ncbi:MAG TPA: universal stress protein [Chloroflexota bacterium]|nr:universal stress protein [Chloroflexota bacterium]
MRILVATGGAAHSDTAVRLGAHLAHKTNSHLTLLTVVHGESARPQAEATLNRAAALTTPYQVVPQKQIRLGAVAPEIVQAAQRGEYVRRPSWTSVT